MAVSKGPHLVKRYYTKGDFNPRSKDQMLAYLESQQLEAGPAGGKSGKPTLDKKVLEQLAKKSQVFRNLLDLRAIQKVESTYVDGSFNRMDSEDRLHATFKHKPSTLRLSCTQPNLQNIVGDKTENTIASGFKKSIVPAPGCVLLEADFSAIEAVLTGWFIKDPNFIRLSKLGIHDYHCSHVIGKPISLTLSDEALGKAFKKLKAEEPVQRNRSKITIYQTLYGASAYGLHKTFPEIFPTVRSADENQQILYRLIPNLPKWHEELRYAAHTKGFLGGPDHPFGYKHWFWDVYSYDPKKGKRGFGADSKRVIAYYPQSTAAGIIKEAALVAMENELFASSFFGQSPIRALIHDSLLCEIEERHLEHAIALLAAIMTKPVQQLPCPPSWNLGAYLSVGVSIKVGPNWGEMKEVETELGTASDLKLLDEEEES